MNENELYDNIAKQTDAITDDMIAPFIAGIIIRRNIKPDTLFNYVVAGLDAIMTRKAETVANVLAKYGIR